MYVEYYNMDVTWDIFHTSFGRLSKILCKYRSCFLCFSLHVYLHICMSTSSQYWKNNDIEIHFKKYTRKWRLEDVSVTVVFDINEEHF